MIKELLLLLLLLPLRIGEKARAREGREGRSGGALHRYDRTGCSVRAWGGVEENESTMLRTVLVVSLCVGAQAFAGAGIGLRRPQTPSALSTQVSKYAAA